MPTTHKISFKLNGKASSVEIGRASCRERV